MNQSPEKCPIIWANYFKITNPLQKSLIRGARRKKAAPNGTAFRQGYRSASSAAMASKAATGSSACVMGRPTTIWEAPLAKAWAGVATRL